MSGSQIAVQCKRTEKAESARTAPSARTISWSEVPSGATFGVNIEPLGSAAANVGILTRAAAYDPDLERFEPSSTERWLVDGCSYLDLTSATLTEVTRPLREHLPNAPVLDVEAEPLYVSIEPAAKLRMKGRIRRITTPQFDASMWPSDDDIDTE